MKGKLEQISFLPFNEKGIRIYNNGREGERRNGETGERYIIVYFITLIVSVQSLAIS